jgi:hypothetical protein
MTWINVSDSLPPECREVYVKHDGGVDLAMRYGPIWRLSSETTDSSEDQLHGVVSWSEDTIVVPRWAIERTPEVNKVSS